MAKSLKQQQAAAGGEFDKLVKIQKEYDSLLQKKEKGKKYDDERLKFLEKEYKSVTQLEKKINALSDKFNEFNDTIEDSNKELAKTITNFDEVEDSILSIGSGMGKNTKLQEALNSKIESSKSTLSIVSSILQKNDLSSQNQIDNAEKSVEAYKGLFTSVADANKELKRGNITQSEFNDIIKDSYKNFDNLIDNIDESTESGKELKKVLAEARNEMSTFEKAAKKSSIAMDQLDNAVDQLGSSGIPLVGELGSAFQKLANKDVKGAKAAITALGAAAGALAGKYFGADYDAAKVAANDVKQTSIDSAKEVGKINSEAAFIPQKIQQERNESALAAANGINRLEIEAQYAAKKAANEFANSMKMAGAQFLAASKTALFGKGIGSVNYGAAMLQTAGISAEQVASAMSSAAIATGKMPTAKMGSDMAVLAERTGQSSDDIATINESFQRIDGLSAKMAMNMQEGMRNMADQAGLDLGNLMKEVAESSKEALGYQIKSGPALAKAVAYTQSMGLNFGDVAKAGKNMVLNYKDSIKAEMQLSSMLGEQVDLAEVRAKFAAGDTEGALSSLKSQGLDPADMDMFQQQALQDALGGMDLNSLSKVANNTGKDASLSKGNAKAGNQEFLTKTQSAEATLNAQEASISAQQAIVDAKLSGQIADSFINSPGHKDYLKAQADQAIKSQQLNEEMEKLFKNSDAYNKQLTKTMQLNFVDTIKEGLMSGLAMVSGGVITSFLASKIGGGAGASAMSMITGGGGGAPAAVASPAAKAVSGVQSAAAGVGGAGGGGMGGALSGIASGLAAFANPATLVGLAAITAALVLLQPVIETMVPVMVEMARVVGEVIVKALEMAGPIITSILEGIGYVIESIGKAIAMVITAIGDSLVKIGGIDGGNLLAVAAALIPLSAGLVALGAGELIAGVLGFVGSLFGGGGPTIWEKLKELGDSGPALMQAATAVSVLAPAFAMLSQVDDGENLGALMDNLKSALTKLDDKAQATLKGLAGAMHDFGYGAYALGVVRSNPNLELLAAQIKLLLADDVTSAITKGTPIIQGLQTTLNSFNTSTMGLANSLYMVNPQLMILLSTMNTFSTISAGIDTTTLALTNMASALSEVAKINTTNLTRVPWDKMAGFSKQNGNFVLAQSANNNFNIAQESAKNLQKLATDTKANLQVSKNLQALIAVLANEQAAGTQLIIDGKAVANMLTRRDDNRRATKA